MEYIRDLIACYPELPVRPMIAVKHSPPGFLFGVAPRLIGETDSCSGALLKNQFRHVSGKFYLR